MTDKIARVWNGTEWVIISSPVGIPNSIAVFQAEPPTTPTDGQIWVDSDTTVALEWPTIGIDEGSLQNQIDAIDTQIDAIDTQIIFLEELSMTIALSDEETAISTGTNKITMRAPFAMTLTKPPRASVSVVSSSGNPSVDINKSGASIFSTVLSIDAGEKTSFTATTPAVLSTTSIADDEELTFDIDTAGTGTKGLKITIYYEKT